MLHIPKPTYSRLTAYARELQNLLIQGVRYVSSMQLGQAMGLTAETVRKDIAYLPCAGFRGIGYPVVELHRAFQGVLKLAGHKSMVLAGTNYMARALLEDQVLRETGYSIIGIFGFLEKKINIWENIKVRRIASLCEFVRENRVDVGVISVDAEHFPRIQYVVNQLVNGGIKGIWSFAPVKIVVPSGIYAVNYGLTHTLGHISAKMANQPPVDGGSITRKG